MLVVLPQAKEWAKDVWKVALSPSKLKCFGSAPTRNCRYSMALVTNAKFDGAADTVTVDFDEIEPVLIGTSDETILMVRVADEPGRKSAHSSSLGGDDSDFIRELSSLPPNVATAAQDLLARIRRDSPGWMKRGQRRNFSNAPDNFWYVIVQPVKGNLSITVRGAPDRFTGCGLPVIDDRPGYTRFYLAGPSDVDAAYEIVSRSKQRS